MFSKTLRMSFHVVLHVKRTAKKFTWNVHTSYATLSSGISWNIPRVTCIFKYTKYTKKIQATSGVFHGYTSRKGCKNILYIPCHRKYSGQMGRLGVIQLNCTDRWEGSVEYWRILQLLSCLLFSMAWYKKIYIKPCAWWRSCWRCACRRGLLKVPFTEVEGDMLPRKGRWFRYVN